MRATARWALVAALIGAGVALGGCDTVDNITNMFDTKKKLPGDRKPVFPEGVPGVHQGVPPELTRGYKEPEPPPPPPEEQKKAEEPKPKPKRMAQPKPKPAPAAPRRQIEPAAVQAAPPAPSVAPATQTSQAPGGSSMQSRWPDQSQQQQPQQQPRQPQQQAPSGGLAPWPDQQR